jgi:hypothetical protein
VTASLALLSALPIWMAVSAGAQPTGYSYADAAFQQVREALDKPVEDGVAQRSWFYGPGPISEGLHERYAESPGGERLVQYFDKSRLELTNPNSAPDDPFLVTSGLLVRELVTGAVQIGDHAVEFVEPAEVPLAGDRTNAWPTYAGLAPYVDQLYADRTGEPVTNVLLADGVSTLTDYTNDSNTVNAAYLSYDGPTGPVGYNVPEGFWAFMTQAGPLWDGTAYVDADPLVDWLVAFGYPISDPAWVNVEIGGTPTWVMVQLFERRLLTYAPEHDEPWRVEMGNVGRHYMEWRGIDPDGTVPTPPTPTLPPSPTPTEPLPTPDPNPRLGSDFLAMLPGNHWTYQDNVTGERIDVDIIGLSGDFVEGQALTVRRESLPDGGYELSYWLPDDQLLWLYGWERYDADDQLTAWETYDPPIRYVAGANLIVGHGWASNVWVDSNLTPDTLWQYDFAVQGEAGYTTPAGVFNVFLIESTRIGTDGDEPIGEREFLRELYFAPYVGMVFERRAGGQRLTLIEYTVQ